MKIEVNGEEMRIRAQNIASLMAELDYGDMVCAVAVNGDFVPRMAHDTTQIQENDQVDIVAPMKGG